MKYAVIGCPFENGIRSMLRFERGVTGAADGPKAIFSTFQELFNEKYKDVAEWVMLSLEKYNLEVDAKNINNSQLKKAQKMSTLSAHHEIAAKTEALCADGYTLIGVGGDHSITYPLCKGIYGSKSGRKFGIIYIDAHLDMRPLEPDEDVDGVISSGNAFWRLLEDPKLEISGENVVAIGIHDSRSEVFNRLKSYAEAQSVTIIYDHQVTDTEIDRIVEVVLKTAGDGTDYIYFSMDMDAVSSAFAPGVSAPAESGITDKQLYKLVSGISSEPKVIGFDVVEISSRRLAWFEVVKNERRVESYREKMEKLEQTATVGARAIDCFLSSRT
ncbi:MAG: arginase family protein [Candidatus Bipolaricaulia bacterium]